MSKSDYTDDINELFTIDDEWDTTAEKVMREPKEAEPMADEARGHKWEKKEKKKLVKEEKKQKKAEAYKEEYGMTREEMEKQERQAERIEKKMYKRAKIRGKSEGLRQRSRRAAAGKRTWREHTRNIGKQIGNQMGPWRRQWRGYARRYYQEVADVPRQRAAIPRQMRNIVLENLIPRTQSRTREVVQDAEVMIRGYERYDPFSGRVIHVRSHPRKATIRAVQGRAQGNPIINGLLGGIKRRR